MAATTPLEDPPSAEIFNPRRIGRAGIVEVGSSVALKTAVVLQTVVIARLYGVGDFGSWATALLVIGAVSAILALRLDLYLLATRDEEELHANLNVAFTLSLLFGVVGMAIVFAAAPMLQPLLESDEVSRNVRMLAPVLVGGAFSLPSVIWERQLRYAWPKLPPLLGVGGFLIVAVVARTWWNWDVLGLLTAQLASLVVTAAAVWAFAPLRPRLAWRPNLLRPQLVFGAPLLASGLATFIANQGDDLLVRLFYGDAALGIYVIAFYVPSYAMALVEMMARVGVPALSPLRDSAAELNQAFTMFAKYIAAVAVAAGFAIALFARELVMLLYGPEWSEAVPLVRIFSIAFVLRASTGLHWHILAVLFGRTRYLMWTSFATAGFMVVVATPLIWKYGLAGGAIYSFAQFAIMGPLVRFPLIKDILGDLSFLRSAVAPLVSGSVAALVSTALWQIGGLTQFSLTALLAFPVTYLALLHRLDPQLLSGAVRILRPSHE